MPILYYIKEIKSTKNIFNSDTDARRIQVSGCKELKDQELIIIVGDNNSSNTRRLFEVASLSHPDAITILISSLEELDERLLSGINKVAIASGASTPKKAIDEIIDYLKTR